MGQSLAPYLNRKLLILSPTTSSLEAARAMHEERVGSALVALGKRGVVGIVTDRDLATQALGFGLPAKTPIREIMTMGVYSVDENATLDEVISIMIEECVRRVPVMKTLAAGKRRCVGIISLDDLLAAEALTPKQASQIVRPQVRGKLHLVKPNTRSESRRENTENRFYKAMAKAMSLPRSLGDQVTFKILKSVVCRIDSRCAGHLITEMPANLQEDLYALPAGPDRKITARSVITDLEKQFGFTEELARQVMHDFWDGILAYTSARDMAHILVQLPQDLQEALTGFSIATAAPKKKAATRSGGKKATKAAPEIPTVARRRRGQRLPLTLE